MHYFSIIKAIPASWKVDLFSTQPSINVNIKRLLTFSSACRPSRHVYKFVLNYTAPKCIDKWKEKNFQIPADWKCIFKLPFCAIRNTKIQYFQFRFLHRVLGVNDYLFKLNTVNSPLCSFCGAENETLEHLFWNCSFVRIFWNNVGNLCLKENLDISLSYVIFGYTMKLQHPINFFLLHAKYFIFCCKVNGTKPHAPTFLQKFKFLLSVERYISKEEMTNIFKASLY